MRKGHLNKDLKEEVRELPCDYLGKSILGRGDSKDALQREYPWCVCRTEGSNVLGVEKSEKSDGGVGRQLSRLCRLGLIFGETC